MADILAFALSFRPRAAAEIIRPVVDPARCPGPRPGMGFVWLRDPDDGTLVCRYGAVSTETEPRSLRLSA